MCACLCIYIYEPSKVFSVAKENRILQLSLALTTRVLSKVWVLDSFILLANIYLAPGDKAGSRFLLS